MLRDARDSAIVRRIGNRSRKMRTDWQSAPQATVLFPSPGVYAWDTEGTKLRGSPFQGLFPRRRLNWADAGKPLEGAWNPGGGSRTPGVNAWASEKLGNRGVEIATLSVKGKRR